ncbi:LysM peptidoglycan-binding domain-containing protein [Caldibacillus thermolactis]|uniref:LysM peptidoglycan-binding domain-containing protein n=1 Tax=Pallidibacillus thermolactis TaxID=251051 RepID=A0ABT2WF38_9BACI|nr:LysM peptidoglycan-binding domain-containing protein [Pallidibacillus thermolactis]MCU9594285.1 LysM peptidoglycan-binding domain-containing protein [Pallidibacillus thermolactis]
MKKGAITLAITVAIASLGLWAGQASAKEVVVRKGDTLWDLARQHHTTVNNLFKFNNLQSSIIYPGQVLQTEYLYTVVKGDTLWDISRAFGITVAELKERNNLTSDLIIVGQVLTIPNANTEHINQQVVKRASLAHKQKNLNVTNQDTPVEVQSQKAEEQPAKAEESNKKSTTQSVEKSEEQTESAKIPPVEKPVKQTESAKTQSAEKTVKQAESPKSQSADEPKQETERVETKAASQPNEQSKEAEKMVVEAGDTISVEATAYTVESAGGNGITTIGIDLNKNPDAKVISVDPNVIPLGTKVYVEGYGNAIAGDTGSAIKGNKIDVYLPTEEEALNWGRRTVNVTILE